MSAVRDLPAILVTGVNGYVGRLAVDVLLRETKNPLVLMIREQRFNPPTLLNAFAEISSLTLTPTMMERIRWLPFSHDFTPEDLAQNLAGVKVGKILHCAGSVSYFNREKLSQGNEGFTAKMIALGKALGIAQFVFISTAFSCGYVQNKVAEVLHQEPAADPNDYTLSKRQTEGIVAQSGLPYLILRPSVLIGDSQTGAYHGRPYGLYQLMMGGERFLFDRYRPEMHVLAARTPIHFLHQDTFQKVMRAALEHFSEEKGKIVNLVSQDDDLPNMRDIWTFWIENCFRPEKVSYYETFEQLPLEKLEPKERLWMEFTAANNEIGGFGWKFATNSLDDLRQKGLTFPATTRKSVNLIMEVFLQNSRRMQNYLQKHPKREVTGQV